MQKHIYVHVPPPEDEVIQPQQVINQGVRQKHYKIIFIKAPSISAQQQAQINLANQQEEKTIVYVLVKKPDEQGPLSIPNQPLTPPSKPEVYFIKYKTQQGAAQAQAGGYSGGGGGGAVGPAPSAQYGPPQAQAGGYKKKK